MDGVQRSGSQRRRWLDHARFRLAPYPPPNLLFEEPEAVLVLNGPPRSKILTRHGMKHILLAGIVWACTLAAQPKPGTGSIEGHVFNSVTGAPVRKASVTLKASQLQVWLTADSDANGRFEFTSLPSGAYKLSAIHSGF